MRRLIHKNPDTGVEQWYVSDPMEGKFRFETVQNVTPYVEAAKRSFNNTDERAKWGEMAHVATIPLSVLADLKRRGIADDEKKMKAWLNAPDNRYFRVRPGRV
jgi:hypothetical protein